ncbi:MAG: outer membrane protein assembly factor BamD [Polyangiaceae bacterium]
MLRLSASVLVGLGLLVPACASAPKRPPTALDYSENAKRDYDKAMRALEDKDWEVVEPLFNEVRKNYSYSRYARLAELRIADANYRQDKLPEAISGYRSFLHDYPNDPEVPYARFQIARAEYDSVSLSPFLPALEERDLTSVNDALATIRGYLADYPNSEHSEELRYMLEVVLGLLARHELYVARYYLAKDRFDAAAARVDHAVSSFPRSGLEAEGLLLLAEIRLKQKRPSDARKLCDRLLKEHPESPFSVAAKNYLARLGPDEPVGMLQQASEKKPAGAVPAAPPQP